MESHDIKLLEMVLRKHEPEVADFLRGFFFKHYQREFNVVSEDDLKKEILTFYRSGHHAKFEVGDTDSTFKIKFLNGDEVLDTLVIEDSKIRASILLI